MRRIVSRRSRRTEIGKGSVKGKGKSKGNGKGKGKPKGKMWSPKGKAPDVSAVPPPSVPPKSFGSVTPPSPAAVVKAVTAASAMGSVDAGSTGADSPVLHNHMMLYLMLILLLCIALLFAVRWYRTRRVPMTWAYLARTSVRAHMDPNCGPIRTVPIYAFKIPTDAKRAVFRCELCAGGAPPRARAEFQNRRRLRRVEEENQDVQMQREASNAWPSRPARPDATSGLTRQALLSHRMQQIARDADRAPEEGSSLM